MRPWPPTPRARWGWWGTHTSPSELQGERVPAFSSLSLHVCPSGQGVEAVEGPQKGRESQGCLSLAVHGAGRAARAQSKGCFQAEIVPVTTTVHDDKGTERSVTVAQDEGIRPSTTMEGLAKLKPSFKKGGSTTAGETGLGEGERKGPCPC